MRHMLSLFGMVVQQVFEEPRAWRIAEACLDMRRPYDDDPATLYDGMDLGYYPKAIVHQPELRRRAIAFAADRRKKRQRLLDENPGYDPAAVAREAMRALILEETARLEADLPRLKARDLAKRDRLYCRMTCDLTAKSRNLSKYETNHRRTFHKALNDFFAYRKNKKRDTDAEPEPEIEVEIPSQDTAGLDESSERTQTAVEPDLDPAPGDPPPTPPEIVTNEPNRCAALVAQIQPAKLLKPELKHVSHPVEIPGPAPEPAPMRDDGTSEIRLADGTVVPTYRGFVPRDINRWLADLKYWDDNPPVD